MKKDPRFFLDHIIDSIEDIESYLKNISTPHPLVLSHFAPLQNHLPMNNFACLHIKI